jgi:hypothetical protein
VVIAFDTSVVPSGCTKRDGMTAITCRFGSCERSSVAGILRRVESFSRASYSVCKASTSGSASPTASALARVERLDSAALKAPPNNEMKLTKPAFARMARSSQLISVLGGRRSSRFARLAAPVAALLAAFGGCGAGYGGDYSPPPPPAGSTCYRLTLSDWVPPVSPQDIAWIMPPPVVALTPLTAEGLPHAARRILPDKDPAIPEQRMAFAHWRKNNGQIELVWTNGFAGLTMRLSPRLDDLEGSGETVSDVIGEAPRCFKAQAKRVDCRQVTHGKAAAQR